MRLSPTWAMKPCDPAKSSAESVVPIPRLAASARASSWILAQARCTACSSRLRMVRDPPRLSAPAASMVSRSLLQLLVDDAHRQRARDLARRVPAHAVGDHEEAELLVDEVVVLVVVADARRRWTQRTGCFRPGPSDGRGYPSGAGPGHQRKGGETSPECGARRGARRAPRAALRRRAMPSPDDAPRPRPRSPRRRRHRRRHHRPQGVPRRRARRRRRLAPLGLAYTSIDARRSRPPTPSAAPSTSTTRTSRPASPTPAPSSTSRSSTTPPSSSSRRPGRSARRARAASELGIVFYDKRLYDKAAAWLGKAVAAAPDDARARYALGLAHEARRDMGAAVSAYREAVRRYRRSPTRASRSPTRSPAWASTRGHRRADGAAGARSQQREGGAQPRDPRARARRDEWPTGSSARARRSWRRRRLITEGAFREEGARSTATGARRPSAPSATPCRSSRCTRPSTRRRRSPRCSSCSPIPIAPRAPRTTCTRSP